MPDSLQMWEALPPMVPRNSTTSDAASCWQWDFNIWLFDDDEFLPLTMHILNGFNFPVSYGITTTKWCNFIWRVQKLMNRSTNPYHNFRHITDVTQTCACIIKEFGAGAYLNHLETFSLLMSCIVHDLEHPGLNNMYQVNAVTPLAIRYNDVSVLENHHCATAFEVFSYPECSVIDCFTSDQKRMLRKVIISLVLSTDMSQHFHLKDEVDRLGAKKIHNNHHHATVPSDLRLDEPEKQILMKAILHISDISNPAKAWATCKKWSDLVLQEFFEQGDRERDEGLPISMNCDRSTTHQDELSMNFSDFIVQPFFIALTRVLPKMILATRQLDANRQEWFARYQARVATNPDEPGRKEEGLERWTSRAKQAHDKMRELETCMLQCEDFHDIATETVKIV